MGGSQRDEESDTLGDLGEGFGFRGRVLGFTFCRILCIMMLCACGGIGRHATLRW